MTGQLALEICDDAVVSDFCLDLTRRGKDAAARYLARRGYEILERDWKCIHGSIDIIALEVNVTVGEYVLVFVGVTMCYGADFAEETMVKDRERYERLAISYLSAVDCVDMRVRFDEVVINVIAPDRAFIRRHLDVLGADAD